MKSIVKFSTFASRLPGGTKMFLETTGCGPDVATVETYEGFGSQGEMVDLLFEESDERIEKVLALVRQHGETPLVDRYYEFTEEERQSAPLLFMDNEENESVMAGAVEGTTYDLTNACPTCGMGARQTSPLYIFHEALPELRKHRAIGSEEGEILVNRSIAKKLRDNGVTGIASFGDVYARTENGGRSLVARKQIFVDHTLPPAVSKSPLERVNACRTCHRGTAKALLPKPHRTIYRPQDLADIRDMNLSWEWYGQYEIEPNPPKLHLPAPRTLVTPKVMNIFREAGVTTFEWTPIFVEN